MAYAAGYKLGKVDMEELGVVSGEGNYKNPNYIVGNKINIIDEYMSLTRYIGPGYSPIGHELGLNEDQSYTRDFMNSRRLEVYDELHNSSNKASGFVHNLNLRDQKSILSLEKDLREIKINTRSNWRSRMCIYGHNYRTNMLEKVNAVQFH